MDIKYVKIKPNQSAWENSMHPLHNRMAPIPVDGIYEVIRVEVSTNFPSKHNRNSVFITKQGRVLAVECCIPIIKK